MSDGQATREALQKAVCRAYRVSPRWIGVKLPLGARMRLWLLRQIDGTHYWLVKARAGCGDRDQ
jgi:hypothetical protein